MGTESLDIKPERFGRYVLLDRVGVGGMAEVFRAVMPGAQGFQRMFVVKRILGERAQSPYFVDMFVREARINAVLHHPNIVQVFDFGEVNGTYFLAMEYVRGRDVSAIARRLRHRARPCPVGVAACIAHEVAQALGYAHALTSPEGTPLNVVHRDVSPSNIICQRAGGVKLLDFGIAQALTEPEAEKTQRMFKGKIAYVAPERIKGQPADSRSDLFSLGVVLWELLAGRKLFRGKSEVETLHNVVEMPVPALSSIRADVAPELEQIVARAPRPIGGPGSDRARAFDQPVRRGRVAVGSMITIRQEPWEGSLNLPRRSRWAKPSSVNAMGVVAIAVVIALFAGLRPAAAETRNPADIEARRRFADAEVD
ncbi:MAG TPA: serine/threonine-protein kinase, partial [Polyangia bacterium]|nr:serine/threonine-protein kinase [Polyangia bacterium]